MINFIDIKDFSTSEVKKIIKLSKYIKKLSKEDNPHLSQLASGKKLIMIFEKLSTRTRISFNVGIQDLGGNAIIIDQNTTHLGTNETIADTACVLSRMADIVMIRCYKHSDLLEFSQYSTIPIINGLTDYSHPCQIMAAFLTFLENLEDADISGKKLTWIGDGNNVLTSYIHLATKFDFQLNISCPEEYLANKNEITIAQKQGAKISIINSPLAAAKNADVIITDSWISMGDENKAKKRKAAFAPYQVNEKIMAVANKNAIFSHCLPAHRNYEVTDGVIDSANSKVFDEAENRIYVQQAIMLYCLNNGNIENFYQ